MNTTPNAPAHARPDTPAHPSPHTPARVRAHTADTLALLRTPGGGLRLAPAPAPPAAGAGLRVLRAGICGTDLQIQRGIRPDGAAVLGHEGLAEYPTGSGVRRVLFNPVDPDDQDHILGHSHDGVLRRRYPTPGDGPAAGGDFSTAADPVLRHLVPALPDLPADLSVLVEPLGAVLYGWDLLDAAGAHGDAAVWGSGTTAVLAALVGEARGLATTLVHTRAERLEWLRRREVFDTTRLSTAPPAGPVAAAFVCLPREAAGAALGQALDTVGDGGAIDLFGGFGTGGTHPLTGALDLNSVRRANVCGSPAPAPGPAVTLPSGKRVRLTGHRGTSAAHLRRAQELLIAHPERFARVVSHVVPLEAAGPVLRSMAADPPGARLVGLGPAGEPLRGEHLKVLVDPTLPAGAVRAPDPLTTVAALPPGH
ncbi:dehydrogenase [Streptomyces sp. NPDC012421]|uniref:dehydrogenase n=1 Tax=Streptomyces sp. NPDC012421 TaxID=3364832 RepID=UPI0036EABBB8